MIEQGSRILQWMIIVVLASASVIPAQAQSQPASGSIESIIATRQQAVVKLFGAGVGNLDSYGSAVIVTPEGHLLTVWNHLINAGYLTAVTSDGRKHSVKVVGTSAEHDLALLQLETKSPEGYPCISLNDVADASTGDSVLAFSNMFHVATGNEPVSVVHGSIAITAQLAATQGRWNFPVQSDVLIIDAITNNSGSAGGLLTLRDGTPVGLIGREIRHRTSSTWVNYAVPLSTLRPIVETLLAGGRIETKRPDSEAGAGLSDRVLTQRFGITLVPNVVERTPAFVDDVVPSSLAEQAGLQRGDLIVLLDDDIITSVIDFQKQMATRRPGSRIAITVNRDQQLLPISLRVP